MALRFWLIIAVAAALALPAPAFAQATPESTPVAFDETDFFAGSDGYGGGATVSLVADGLDPAKLLIVTGSVAAFDTDTSAAGAFASASAGYDKWLERPIDPAFDFAAVNRARTAPVAGDEALLFRGNAISRAESGSRFSTAIIVVRSGTTIITVTGMTVTGDAVDLTEAIVQAILASAPAAVPVPVDGSPENAPIWEWTPAPDDELLDGFTIVERTWFDATGTAARIAVLAQ